MVKFAQYITHKTQNNIRPFSWPFSKSTSISQLPFTRFGEDFIGYMTLPDAQLTVSKQISKVECGPMPNVMAALPNIGGALCSAPQFGWRPLLECRAVTLPRCETRWNSLACPKLANRSQPSAASGLKFTILWGHVDEILPFNKFFPIVDTCLSCDDSARQSCMMVPRWRFFASFLRAVFPASRVQHISDLHSKFALRPHHV